MADYDIYIDAFRGYLGFRFEPGFHIIKYVASLLGNVVFWGFLLYAFMGVGLKFFYISREPSLVWDATLVYLSSQLVIHDMVAIRAGVAASFLLFAVDSKMSGNLKKSLGFILLAVLFHYSAIACLVLLLLNPHKKHRFFYLAALLGSHLLALLGIFLNQYLEVLNKIGPLEEVLGMHTEGDPMNFLNLLQIGHIIICIVLWCKVDAIMENYSKALLYLKLYTIGLCAMPLLALMISMALRMSALFLVVEILLIPMGLKCIFKNQLLNKYLLIMYSLIIFYFTFSDRIYWG